MDILDALKQHIDGMCGGPETIDGSDVEAVAAECCDLDVEYSPVLFERQPNDNYKLMLCDERYIPKPTVISKDGSRYCIPLLRYVSEDEMKVARTRFILTKNYLYRNMRRMPYPVQHRVMAYYFPDGTWLPPEGSELSKAMGMESGDAPQPAIS